VRPSNHQDWLLKIKLFRVGSLGTRLMRAPLAHSPPTTHGGALVPLDTANREKLLYSNPRLLRSSPLGETCPPHAHAQAWRFSLAAPMLPTEATDARSRPTGRLAVGCTAPAHCGFGGSTWPDSWLNVAPFGWPIGSA
jgi:hypothetical protein